MDFQNIYDTGVFVHNGKKVPVNPYKYIYDMTLEQLAFWKKLQYDHKVYLEDNIDNFTIKIAYDSSQGIRKHYRWEVLLLNFTVRIKGLSLPQGNCIPWIKNYVCLNN